MSDQRYTPPKASIEAAASSAPASEPRGIGGWLILVVIGLVLTPFRLAQGLLTNHWPIFRDGHWAELTTAGTEAYHPMWAPLLVFEVVGNLVMLVLPVVILVLFFRHSRRAPLAAIFMYAFSALFLIVDELLGRTIPAVAESTDHESLKELSRAVLIAAIWIPYFLRSKRVKNTFTR
jgi:hypothetical protein